MLSFIALGLVAGVFSGLVGVGGGIIIVPALVFLFGLTQGQAQGTTLALMVPPVGALAAWTYYKQGLVDVRIAILICLGFFVGGLIGSRVAVSLPTVALQRIFGASLFLISLKYLFAR